jgi:hypothetical protein
VEYFCKYLSIDYLGSANPSHAYRRAWATARKHLPVTDVAAAGGWRSTATIQRCYQQPDEGTILAVVLGGAELREKRRESPAFLYRSLYTPHLGPTAEAANL